MKKVIISIAILVLTAGILIYKIPRTISGCKDDQTDDPSDSITFEKFVDPGIEAGNNLEVPYTRIVLHTNSYCFFGNRILAYKFDLGTYKGECKEIKKEDWDMASASSDTHVSVSEKHRIQCLYNGVGKEIRKNYLEDDIFYIADIEKGEKGPKSFNDFSNIEKVLRAQESD